MSFVGVCVWFFLRACGNGVPTCATYRHSDDELRVPVHPRVAACVCIYCIESASRKEAAFRPSLALISPYFVSSTPIGNVTFPNTRPLLERGRLRALIFVGKVQSPREFLLRVGRLPYSRLFRLFPVFKGRSPAYFSGFA